MTRQVNGRTIRVWAEDGVWQADRGRWLPYYLDEVELGIRVSDHINSPGEEDMLADMMQGNKWWMTAVGVVEDETGRVISYESVVQ